jgi:GPH family glycoside/pentoside/hexuronide:cation symporter
MSRPSTDDSCPPSSSSTGGVTKAPAVADRVPFSTKLAYGSGAFTETVLVNAIKQLANPVLNLQLGLSPGWVGMLLAIPRLWDAFTDLVVGNVSDHASTRWGRRKPFILAGGIFSALTFSLLWMMPGDLSSSAVFWYFLIGSLVFYLAYTFFSIPWTALGYELATSYEDRTSLMSVKTFCATVSALLPPWLLALTQLPVFSNTLEGARWISILIGLMVIAVTLVVVIFVKERKVSATPRAKKAAVPFLPSFLSLMRNVPFIMLVAIVILMLFAIIIEGSLGLYINIYYVHRGDLAAAANWNGILGTLYNALGLATVFAVPSIARAIDKKFALALFLALAFAAAILRWFCFTPDQPYLMLIPTLLIGPSMTAMWILISSMIADLCDLDEVKTGCRREGMFSAVYGWIFKLGISLAYLLGGYALVFSGFDVALGNEQPAATLHSMRLIFVVFPAAAVLAACLLAILYPIGKKQVLAAAALLSQKTA